MNRFILGLTAGLALFCAGCHSDAPTNQGITAAADQLNKASEGAPKAPTLPGLQQMGSGQPSMAPKGIKH